MPNKYEIIVTPVTTRYEINIWDDIEEFKEYDEMLKQLPKIKEEDHVVLRVGTPGGRCDVGFMLIDKFKELGCVVDVIVPYPTYSMGAIMALCGDSLSMSPGSFLMFHDYSTGGRGKGNELIKSTEAYSEIFAYRFRQICIPFLTEEECMSVLQGQDLYIKWNDPSLKKRIKRHFK